LAMSTNAIDNSEFKPKGVQQERHGSVLSGFSVITKSMIGSGIFAMAFACSKFGIIAGVVSLFVAASITYLSLRVLSVIALEYRDANPSFYSVSADIMPKAKWVIDVSLIINCVGGATVYVQTAGTLLALGIGAMTDLGSFSQSNLAMVIQAGMIVALSPLCMMKEISGTWIANLIGLTCLLYIVVMTFFYTPMTSSSNELLYPESFVVALGTFPSFIFAFACQQNVFSVANELKDANMKRLDMVSVSSTLTGLLIYLPMMIIPFLTFGKQTQSNYIYGFDANEVPVQIAYIFAALSVSISYVLQIQPVRRSVVSLIYGDNPPTGRRELFIRILIVTIVMLLTFGLATALGDDLNLPISITGLLGGNTMCFVMPFLLYLKKFGWRGKRDFMTIAVMGSLAFCVMLYPVCMSGIIYNAIPGDKPPTRV